MNLGMVKTLDDAKQFLRERKTLSHAEMHSLALQFGAQGAVELNRLAKELEIRFTGPLGR